MPSKGDGLTLEDERVDHIGDNCKITAIESCRIVGSSNTVNSPDATVTGDFNIVRGQNPYVQGEHNEVDGFQALVCGNHNKVSGPHVRVHGDHNKVSGKNPFVSGTDNTVSPVHVSKSFEWETPASSARPETIAPPAAKQGTKKKEKTRALTDAEKRAVAETVKLAFSGIGAYDEFLEFLRPHMNK